MKTKSLGFSLFELALVLLVMTMGSLYAIHAFNRDQQRTAAAAVGEQVRTVADAVNGYIVNNYATLIASPTTAVTIANLRTATLLPASFSDTNIQGSGWSISLRRTGSAPNWNIEGLVLLNNPVTDGLTPNLSLSGTALRAIGADGGMSYDGLSISGMEGAWVAAQAQYPAITQVGQVGARVGYGTSQFTQFLRRDGTLPMTGSLNMGGQSINSAANVTASGALSGGSLNIAAGSTLGGAVTANSSLSVAGHAAMNTGEVRLVVGENSSCAGYNSGAFAKDNTGVLLSCQSGIWRKASGTASGSGFREFIQRNNGKTINIYQYNNHYRYQGIGSPHLVAYATFCAACGTYGALNVYTLNTWWPYWGWAHIGTLYPEGFQYTAAQIHYRYYYGIPDLQRNYNWDWYGYIHGQKIAVSMTPYSVTFSFKEERGNCSEFEHHIFLAEHLNDNLLSRAVPQATECDYNDNSTD